MSSESETKKLHWFWVLMKHPVLWGGVASAAVTIVGIVFLRRCDPELIDGVATCSSKFQQLLSAPPNEIGDTLAGFAGTYAFIWIIVTVWLQSKELAAQRQELALNREESAKMARALEAQAAIFEDEKKRRNELRNDEHAEALEASLLETLGRFMGSPNPVWQKTIDPNTKRNYPAHKVQADRMQDRKGTTSLNLKQKISFLENCISIIRKRSEASYYNKYPNFESADFVDLVNILEEQAVVIRMSSPAVAERYRTSSINDLIVSLTALLSQDNAWKIHEDRERQALSQRLAAITI